jgi:tubulin--tyrosine ligase-like protein 12
MESMDAFVSLMGPWMEQVQLPKHLWGVLYQKVKHDVFDSGASFSIAEIEEVEEEESEEAEVGEQASSHSTSNKRVLVSAQDITAEQDVWLIDHAWTFKYREARQQLRADANLRQRLAGMLAVPLLASGAEAPEEEGGACTDRWCSAVQRDVHTIFESLWRLVGSYRQAQGNRTLQEMSDADHDSTWYVMDEVGAAVSWSCDPDDVNVRVATMPVCFPEKGCIFSIMWVVKDLEASETCVALGQYTLDDAQQQKGTVISPGSAAVASMVLHGDLIETTMKSFDGTDSELDDATDSQILWSKCLTAFRERSLLFQKRNAEISLPNTPSDKVYSPLTTEADLRALGIDAFPIPFFTDSNTVINGVTDSDYFRLVALPQDAKIMWMAHYIMRRSDDFPHAAMVSQMSEERFFTNKRRLAALVQKRCGTRPWFQMTYDATTELEAFTADFLLREQSLRQGAQSSDPQTVRDTSLLTSCDGTNLWIAKPCNLARSIDMTVSNNLQWLLRVAQTTPKIFCKYISNPATLRGRKFDLRFILAVRSLHTPETDVEAYLYNVFWTRFASEQYSLDGFDVYAKHWTVMNYADPAKLLQLHYNDFIPEFNVEYAAKLQRSGTDVWGEIVMPRIKIMVREMLESIEPDDIPHGRFRGSYGVDVMLREELDPVTGAVVDLQPVLLEVTFSPDCTRACKYHPSFFNDVFRTLFLGTPQNMTRV